MGATSTMLTAPPQGRQLRTASTAELRVSCMSLCALSEFAYSLLQSPTVKKTAVKEKSYRKSPDHPEIIKPDSYNVLLKS